MAEINNTDTQSQADLLFRKLGDLAYRWRGVSSQKQNAAHIVAEYHEVFAQMWQEGWRGEDLYIDQELPEALMPDYYVSYIQRRNAEELQRARSKLS